MKEQQLKLIDLAEAKTEKISELKEGFVVTIVNGEQRLVRSEDGRIRVEDNEDA